MEAQSRVDAISYYLCRFAAGLAGVSHQPDKGVSFLFVFIFILFGCLVVG